MTDTTLVSAPFHRPANRLLQALSALLIGFMLFILVLGGLVVAFQVAYAGRIYPGVSVAGVDLSGMKPLEATERLAQRLDYSLKGRIAFQDGGTVWLATPLELGLYLDAESSAFEALRVGRRGGPIARLTEQYRAWSVGVDLPPYMVYDERSAYRYVSEIASQVDRPVIEAHLGLKGVEVEVRSGQVGRKVDVEATLEALRPHFSTLTDGLVPLVVHETPPVILDVEAQAQIARQILSAPLTLTIQEPVEGDPGPWTFDPPALAEMLSIERLVTDEGARYQVALNPDDLGAFLEGLAPDLQIEPVNARFVFNDETHELELLESAVIGRRLLVDETVQAINQALAAGQHTVPLVFTRQEPLVADEATAEELGITELVSAHTSYFYGSSAARIQNIQAASSRFHGLLVAPGGTFSMAEALGDVSLDNGYAEALIIYGNRTIKGVGGGVCQVSTTLFRTVFFGGYPVVERHPHAYRVYYYELTAGNRHDPSLAGLDATVYVPLVDMKFTNDTPYWLLMETYVNPSARTLTWKFYSTSDGRSVEYHSTGLRNRVDPPEPLYQENPELDKGEIRQVDWAVEGADVTITRTVYRNGEVYFEDSYTTHYMPWRAVYEYGPGTKGIPTPEATKGEPSG